ncbi:cation diffusion facilitator family transporter [Neptuniibacter halophilus]|uniref:cation diffusion facilitator family transporter n=1 Tax=Neptuniibacter halophilus TaxID=651666 RepID=UPI0025722D5A|nr:cation diffusion facilitator family transporter [Neptuniibacter halophilus]
MNRDHAQNKAATRVTWIGAALDLFLGLLKIGIGIIAHSSALIADGIHSLSDLVTDFMVVLILRISGKGPDQNHPWGHGHFETLGTALLGSLLVAIAGAIAYHSLYNLLTQTHFQMPEWPALLAAGVSILGKEWIYRFTLRIGREIGSDLLIANAWHSRSDALSSIVVFFGVAGAMAGLLWLDAVAAIAVALLVAKIGWDLTWNSLRQLVDTALPEEQVQAYRQQLLQIHGVRAVHDFKTRTMGNQKLLEMHIQVAPQLSASEGHFIGEQACRRLREFDQIGHIIYHIDTYDDADTPPLTGNSTLLPTREQIEPVLDQYLQSLLQEPLTYRLHLFYKRQRINLELLLQQEDMQRLLQSGYTEAQIRQGLIEAFENAPPGTDWLGTIFLASGSE